MPTTFLHPESRPACWLTSVDMGLTIHRDIGEYYKATGAVVAETPAVGAKAPADSAWALSSLRGKLTAAAAAAATFFACLTEAAAPSAGALMLTDN